MWTKFGATINYLGGKRRLVPEIFKHVPRDAGVFADAFLGGGSVSLFAKARGHQVFCNDISIRSVTVGQALIANSEYKITEEDILKLFVPAAHLSFIEKNYAGRMFVTKLARFLDNAFAQVETMPIHKRSLMRLLLIKFIIGTRPFGHFSAVGNVRKLEVHDYDLPLRSKVYAKNSLRQIGEPLGPLRVYAERINRGVFDNGQENRVYHNDVFDFVKKVKADVVYFDPPYADSTSYEESYRVLDSILLQKIEKPKVSAFTKKDALLFQDRLYHSAQHIKHWVISMGQTNSDRGISVEELTAIVRKYRPRAKFKVLEHQWAINNYVRREQEKNTEYLIFTS